MFRDKMAFYFHKQKAYTNNLQLHEKLIYANINKNTLTGKRLESLFYN